MGLPAVPRLMLLPCRDLLGTILVDQAELEEAVLARLEAQEVVRDSQVVMVMDQGTLMTTPMA